MATWLTSTLILLIAIAVGLTARTTSGADRSAPSLAETVSPLQAGFQNMTGDELFAKLLEHNRIREERLRQYSTVRTYEVTNDHGKSYAREVVRVAYQAPDHKSFQIESEEGSAMVRNMVLKRLIESESETASGRAHHDSAIKPANYEFNLLGEQDVGPYTDSTPPPHSRSARISPPAPTPPSPNSQTTQKSAAAPANPASPYLRRYLQFAG
jgi:hypothetical protein